MRNKSASLGAVHRVLTQARYEVLPTAKIEAAVVEYVPRDLTITVTASPTKGIDATLALTERFHDGWTASVDGAAVPAIRVEGDFLGCDLRGGAHRVTFRFMPRSFVYGLIVSGIGLALLATAVLVRLR